MTVTGALVEFLIRTVVALFALPVVRPASNDPSHGSATGVGETSTRVGTGVKLGIEVGLGKGVWVSVGIAA